MSELDSYQQARWKFTANYDGDFFDAWHVCLGCGEEFNNPVTRAYHEAWNCDEAQTKMRLYSAGYM